MSSPSFLLIVYWLSEGLRLTGNRKLVTTIVSTFTAHYVFLWSKYFVDTPLQSPYLPSFDGRAVMYPATKNLRDYMSWRQVDCESPRQLRETVY